MTRSATTVDDSVALPGDWRMTYQPQHGGLVVSVDGNGLVFESALIATSNAAALWTMLTSNAGGVELQDNRQTLVVTGPIELRLTRRVTAEHRMQQLEKQVQQHEQQIQQLQQQVADLLRVQHQQRVRELQANAIVTGSSQYVHVLQTGTDYKSPQNTVYSSTSLGTYLTIDLQEAVFVGELQLRFWDGDNRTYTLTIAESSIDGAHWLPIVK
jgi:DNA-binding transcriptional MerR regulator